MVTERKRRSRYTSVAWSVNCKLHGYVLLLTGCTAARDANSARPGATASNHAMDAVKPAHGVSIHGQHVIDLPVVHLGFVSRELDRLFVHGGVTPQGALETLDHSFWCRVLEVYEEEVGMMYPFLDINQQSHEILKRQTQSYSGSLRSGSLYGEGISNIAFLVLAIVSSFEGSKPVEIVSLIVEEVFVSTIPKIRLQSPNLGDLTLLALTCIFFFLNDREKEAWRLIGTFVRLAHEKSPQEEETAPENISDTFSWSLYTLDRRWSFGTGLPSAVQDSEINRPSLPTMSETSSSAATLASRLQVSTSTQDYLQFRVLQWQQNLPCRLQFNGVDEKFDVAIEKRGDYMLLLMLYLRANQMRTIILRKAASRFGSHNIDTSNFQVMIQVARDTIQVLARLARETDIYHAQHKAFNHFLETAFSAVEGPQLRRGEYRMTSKCLSGAC
ncbi:fungal specific transcription factor factor domain-containing protein [Fusarium mundagurra]|uniref:Fungal specific transcription factor factor domain-containing protein n=1 Tax=Fusarium mundagurra TaxID=1567541 RepID=A0A8H5Z6I6_9HYPO|nr:fungal specific transcription factor factor domain-containing protein [Fusarium mundagurra]